MISYEVRLLQSQTVKAHATISVEAENEAEAAQKAIAFARAGGAHWSETLGAAVEKGDITVDGIEEIVDLDNA